MKKEKNKEVTDQSLSGMSSTTTHNNVADLGGAGITNSTYYYQTLNGEVKTKTRTVDIYKINKKGKQVLVGKHVVTTTKTTYPTPSLTYTNPYTLTTSDGNNTTVTAYPAGPVSTYTATASCDSGESNGK